MAVVQPAKRFGADQALAASTANVAGWSTFIRSGPNTVV
jgi:hypothetical protein